MGANASSPRHQAALGSGRRVCLGPRQGWHRGGGGGLSRERDPGQLLPPHFFVSLTSQSHSLPPLLCLFFLILFAFLLSFFFHACPSSYLSKLFPFRLLTVSTIPVHALVLSFLFDFPFLLRLFWVSSACRHCSVFYLFSLPLSPISPPPCTRFPCFLPRFQRFRARFRELRLASLLPGLSPGASGSSPPCPFAASPFPAAP